MATVHDDRADRIAAYLVEALRAEFRRAGLAPEVRGCVEACDRATKLAHELSDDLDDTIYAVLRTKVDRAVEERYSAILIDRPDLAAAAARHAERLGSW